MHLLILTLSCLFVLGRCGDFKFNPYPHQFRNKTNLKFKIPKTETPIDFNEDGEDILIKNPEYKGNLTQEEGKAKDIPNLADLERDITNPDYIDEKMMEELKKKEKNYMWKTWNYKVFNYLNRIEFEDEDNYWFRSYDRWECIFDEMLNEEKRNNLTCQNCREELGFLYLDRHKTEEHMRVPKHFLIPPPPNETWHHDMQHHWQKEYDGPYLF